MLAAAACPCRLTMVKLFLLLGLLLVFIPPARLLRLYPSAKPPPRRPPHRPPPPSPVRKPPPPKLPAHIPSPSRSPPGRRTRPPGGGSIGASSQPAKICCDPASFSVLKWGCLNPVPRPGATATCGQSLYCMCSGCEAGYILNSVTLHCVRASNTDCLLEDCLPPPRPKPRPPPRPQPQPPPRLIT